MKTVYSILFSLLILNLHCLCLEECSEDQNEYWTQSTRQLLEQIDTDPKTFEHLFPKLATELRQLRDHSSWLDFWGTSFNYDENVQAPIVDARIVNSLAQLTGKETLATSVFHAGILHTYGYLFSLCETPYGYKRKRWISNTVETGLGLPPRVWGPYPDKGNFLANITFVAVSLAFKENIDWALKVKNLDMVSPALRGLDFSHFPRKRIQETISIQDSTFILKTDLIPFKHPLVHDNDAYLLIYSIKDEREEHPKLITVFPIQDQEACKLVLQEQGVVKDIRFKYNLYVPGMKKGLYTGTRSIY